MNWNLNWGHWKLKRKDNINNVYRGNNSHNFTIFLPYSWVTEKNHTRISKDNNPFYLQLVWGQTDRIYLITLICSNLGGTDKHNSYYSEKSSTRCVYHSCRTATIRDIKAKIWIKFERYYIKKPNNRYRKRNKSYWWVTLLNLKCFSLLYDLTQ